MLCAYALTIFGLDEGESGVALPEMGRNRRNARFFFCFQLVTLKVVFSVDVAYVTALARICVILFGVVSLPLLAFSICTNSQFPSLFSKN